MKIIDVPCILFSFVAMSSFRYIPFYPLFQFFRLVAQNGGIHYTKLPTYLIYFMRYLLLEPFRITELVLFERAIMCHKLEEDPVFVIGHWRSGTSHLQNLIRLDPNFTSVSIYSSLFPETFIVTQSWLKPFLQRIAKTFNLEYKIQRTPLNLDYPGELDTALCSMSSSYSYTWGHIFTKNFNCWMDRFVFRISEKDEKSLISEYDYLIRKVSYSSGGKRVVVKSPGDTGRISALKKKYPKAKFVFIKRDPVAVYESNIALWNLILQGFSLHSIKEKTIKNTIIITYKKLIGNYEEQKNSLPKEDLFEIDFGMLQKEPVKLIQSVYRELDLGSPSIKKLEEFVITNKHYVPKTYATPEKIIEELKHEWPSSFR